MLRFEIRSTEVAVKSGVSRRGRPFEIKEQTAFLNHNDESRKVVFALERDAQPYAPGVYTIDPSSFYVDGFGQVQMRLRLRPVAAEARKVG